jgi:hypothetical protein
MGFSHRKTKLERIKSFVNLIDIRGPKECWLWKGKRNKDGQAFAPWIAGEQMRLVHRISMEIHLGRPLLPCTKGSTGGELVRHTCDVPYCCNPYHLLLGTQSDNIQDAVSRGRTPKGTNKPNAKLTENKVREIRKKYTPGYGWGRLAKEYGVAPGTIRQVLDGRAWNHVK